MHLLVDVNIDGAGNHGDFALNFLGDPVAGGGIAGDNLNVDGSGKAEIQDLVGDVGGLKEEDFVGKALPEHAADGALGFFGGAVFFGIKGDEDLAIGRADGGVIAPCEGEGGVGQADIVGDAGNLAGLKSLADGLFHAAENAFGLFDARAFGGAHMEANLAGIDVGEEVGSDDQEQADGGDHEAAINQGDAHAVMQAPAEQLCGIWRAFFRTAY